MFAEQRQDCFSGVSESLGWAVVVASFPSEEMLGAGGCTCTGNGMFRAQWYRRIIKCTNARPSATATLRCVCVRAAECVLQNPHQAFPAAELDPPETGLCPGQRLLLGFLHHYISFKLRSVF